MLNLQLKPVEREVFHSDTVFVGTFRCGSEDPLFRNSGACNSNAIVFPRSATLIHRSRRDSFVADPNTVVVYNVGDEYTRERISPVDLCDWYVLADDLLSEMIEARQAGSRQSGRPFPVSHIYSDDRLYFAQRRFFQSVRLHKLDRAAVEEGVLAIAGQVLDQIFGITPRLPPRSARQRATVESVRSYLNSGPAQDVGLRNLAEIAGCSPFHLCRLFRRVTGQTLTDYRHSLRMRHALRLVCTSSDLADVAFSLGYSSHSHFSKVFRTAFGVTPSQYRLEH